MYINCEEVKAYYSHLKRKWSQKDSYYKPSRKLGEEYGYELKEPYTLEEVEEYERTMGYTLPAPLKEYLTLVSCELFVSYYPYVFNLEKDKANILCDNIFFLKEGEKISIDFEGACENNDCWCDDGMECIGEDGCSFDDFIVVNGPQKGSVWNSDGDNLYKKYENFIEYIKSGMNNYDDPHSTFKSLDN